MSILEHSHIANSQVSVETSRQQKIDRTKYLLGRTLLYLMLAVGAIIVSIPWFWMISSALKSNAELHQVPITILPEEAQWGNFREALLYDVYVQLRNAGLDINDISFSDMTESMWPKLISNTLIIATLVIFGTLASCSIVAYGFARLRWKGRGLMFFIVLATMMLPTQVILIPQYLIFTKIFGWANTWYPQIVPAFFGSAWAIFLLRQFMLNIPREIDESARLDGCSDLQLYWHIILPLTRPALGAIAIFTFGAVWNDLFTPLLYIRDLRELGNVATGLSSMRQVTSLFGGMFPRDELTMAAALVISLPMVLVFFIFQKQYIQGVVITGVK